MRVLEWRGAMVRGVSSLSSLLSCLLVFFFVLVFGVVRAQPCEHARYPRTPLCSLVFFSCPPLFFCAESRVRLPCVRVFGWHDSNRESVSFVFVFLVVARSAFPSSSVAASAVAFGAEDSAVVWVVGSA